MKRSALLLFVILTLGMDSLQAQDKFTIFGGYSYARPSLTQTETSVCPPGQDCHIVVRPLEVNTDPSLRGLDLSASLSVLRWLGVKADFGYYHGTALDGSSANVQTYLFGPEVRRPGRFSPFAHVLLGVAHEATSMESISVGMYDTLLGTSETAFALALGGGVDIRVIGPVSIRPVQIDYLRTSFPQALGPNNNSQGQARLSAGMVLHF